MRSKRIFVRHRRRAVARAEAIVVSSMLLLLCSAIVGSARNARALSRTLTCENRLRMYGAALQVYANLNDGFIPGVNTSGVGVRAKLGLPSSAYDDPRLPAQSWDWITPLLLDEVELPARRLERMYTLFKEYGCPDQTRFNDAIYAPGLDPAELQGLTEVNWPATSYLMPAYFSAWGRAQAGQVVGTFELNGTPITAIVIPTTWEVRVPSFHGTFDGAGPADRKVFATDGTRYLEITGTLDFDARPAPDVLGAFSDGGAWWPGSTAFGVRTGTPNWSGDAITRGSASEGNNLPLSYRHGPRSRNRLQTSFGRAHNAAVSNLGTLNALYFDGHVAPQNDEQSRAIAQWYPTGSTVIQPIGMTTVPAGTVIP